MSEKYVIEKLLWLHNVQEFDDLIKVVTIDEKKDKVLLQPMLGEEFVVSLEEFKRNYVTA